MCVDPTSLIIPFFLVQPLSWTPPHIESACAQTYDPPACYDEWQATKNADDAIMMGNWKTPLPSTGSFYDYIDPPATPTVESPICDDKPSIPDTCD